MASAINPSTGDFYIHGGRMGNGTLLNDFYRINLKTNTLTAVSLQTGPSARADHGECMKWDSVNNRIILFRGYSSTHLSK